MVIMIMMVVIITCMTMMVMVVVMALATQHSNVYLCNSHKTPHPPPSLSPGTAASATSSTSSPRVTAAFWHQLSCKTSPATAPPAACSPPCSAALRQQGYNRACAFTTPASVLRKQRASTSSACNAGLPRKLPQRGGVSGRGNCIWLG
jgi:hypothetical protein